MTITLSGTSGITTSTWTTGSRPSSPSAGQSGYNTSLGVIEFWNGSTWLGVGGLITQAVQTSNFTAAVGSSYPVDTSSGAITVTLPASPTAGQQINVFDYAGTAGTYAITLNPNGGKINGVAGSIAMSTRRGSVTMVYVNSTQGWVVLVSGNDTNFSSTYSVSYLVVAGGGSGGQGAGSGNYYNGAGGGGGAGGMLTGSLTLSSKVTYTATVGSSNSNSVFSSATAIAGGAGGNGSAASGTGGPGGAGGSGGGAGSNGRDSYSAGSAGGAGTAGQGYAGGGAASGNAKDGGGGGGAGGVGTAYSAGAGASSSITGSAVTYAAGAIGGGGYTSAAGTAGAANTGNGGGGGGGGGTPPGYYVGGAGGSGVVILSIPTINYSGITTGSPTVTVVGSNTVIKFTSSGTYTA